MKEGPSFASRWSTRYSIEASADHARIDDIKTVLGDASGFEGKANDMGVVACLTFTVVDPKARALPIMMRALRRLGRERTDHDGNLVVRTSLPDGEPPDRLASDEEIERDFARGEPFIMIFNRPGEYFAMDSITCYAKRENGVSKIELSTREAKYDTYDPGPMFAETMKAFSDHFLKFTVEYEAS